MSDGIGKGIGAPPNAAAVHSILSVIFSILYENLSIGSTDVVVGIIQASSTGVEQISVMVSAQQFVPAVAQLACSPHTVQSPVQHS